MIATFAIGGIIYPSTTYSDLSKAIEKNSPLDVLSYNQSAEAIKGAVVYLANQYGINKDEMIVTIQCESNFNVTAVGDHGLAYGLSQFHKTTFDSYCKGNYHSAKDQLVCMAQMFSKRMQHHWTCWTKNFN